MVTTHYATIGVGVFTTIRGDNNDMTTDLEFERAMESSPHGTLGPLPIQERRTSFVARIVARVFRTIFTLLGHGPNRTYS